MRQVIGFPRVLYIDISNDQISMFLESTALEVEVLGSLYRKFRHLVHALGAQFLLGSLVILSSKKKASQLSACLSGASQSLKSLWRSAEGTKIFYCNRSFIALSVQTLLNEELLQGKLVPPSFHGKYSGVCIHYTVPCCPRCGSEYSVRRTKVCFCISVAITIINFFQQIKPHSWLELLSNLYKLIQGA